MAFRFQPGSPIAKQLPALLAAEARAAGHCAVNTRIPLAERVRVVRKACKKIRAALRLARRLDAATYARENAWLRETAHALAPLRDAAMLESTFDKVLRRSEKGPAIPAATVRVVRARLNARRQTAWPSERKAAQLMREVRVRLETSSRRLQRWRLQADDTDFIQQGFRCAYRRARRRGRAAGSVPDGGAYHQWRKAVQVHQVHLQLLRWAWPAPMEVWRDEVRRLRKVLGKEHDLAVFTSWLQVECETTPGLTGLSRLQATVQRRRQALRQKADDLGQRLLSPSAKRPARALAAWWSRL